MPGLFNRLSRPLSGIWLLRRVLAELRGIRRALDRQADALELANGTPPESVSRTTFRSYARLKEQASESDLRSLTDVSYVDNAVLGAMLNKEEELRVILGRNPSEDEIMRAYQGEEP